MRDFIISTDATADLPDSFYQENGIQVLPLYYIVDNVQYGGQNTLPLDYFYKIMREGAMVTTSASNPDVIINMFEKKIADGYDVLHISFSSALSCSYNNTCIMAREIVEEHPEACIKVVDSICASLGQGLLVYYAVQLKKAGKSLSEVVEWIEQNKGRICHQFTVDDLKYLYRGGRISKSVAILGTLINVKPILTVDKEGRLVPTGNVRGRKKALNTLVNNMELQSAGVENSIIFISHCDALEDAQYVADLIRQKFGITNFLLNPIGPAIGAHSGPGTVALFYLGNSRE